ncbi:MAG: class I SAM-dependent methyltransferase [Candidatus Melainabacteria bacterium]|nr:class I SAM-dependent methyltransferase [Candidatus Melainabacteria bacterium]
MATETRELVGGEALFELLCRNWLLVNPLDPAYDDYFQGLNSVLDRSHLGTFHQRVGQFLGIKLRLKDERWRWWHDQKFTSDGLSLKEGPYKEIQERFVDDYFCRNPLKNKRVLDFACGNGFYTRKFASMGAKVLGIDTSEELIGIATRIHGELAEFSHVQSIEEEYNLLARLNGEFDAIFMQDVLLLLVNPEDGSASLDITQLLKLLRQSLKNGGSLYLMEPNATFWLASYYGDSGRPYAIVTEYMNRLFNVMPILPVIIDVMSKAGLALIEYEHPRPPQDTKSLKSNEFPSWDFMRFVPL